MCKVLIFAGTTEGRILAERLSKSSLELYFCVATEYGEKLLPKGDNIKVSNERLDQNAMENLINKEKFDLIVDATHPYAVEVSKNIVKASENTNTEYLRLLRSSEENTYKSSCIYVNSIEEAVEKLNETEGNVLIATGSKELHKFTVVNNYKERLFARVLSTVNVVDECTKLGFEGRNLICMQGPFTEEFNIALLKQISAKYMVTKESGKVGGFIEKITACIKAGATPIVIGRPTEEEGKDLESVIDYIKNKFSLAEKRKVSIVGIGMGNMDTMTIEAKKAFEEADIIIGAKRMVDSLSGFNKYTFASYKAEEIHSFLDRNKKYKNIVIAMSGDTGFYSGTKKLLEELKDYEVKNICGISSVVYFASKLNISWENMELISLHGREDNVIDAILNNEKVFALLSGKDSIHSVCKELIEYELRDVELYIGERLSYEDECIYKGKAEDFIDKEFKPLSVMVMVNKNYNNKIITPGISDENFIRGEVPMTKEEVRALSISKLALNKDSIIYDVGAGTGSLAIEMALLASKGKVYAIEKNPKGIELINQNKKHFKASNLHVVEGIAPEACLDLEEPTHAFIGGSSGNLKEIVKMLLDKNPNVKIVVNSITLETVAETLEVLKTFKVKNVDIVSLSVAKSKRIARYNMMMGQNPIYIITFEGDLKDE
ncbi:MAG: precorrin-6A reductase [Clostridium sp.]|nr:precorrin-6A reductase [Clostridium sp.]